MRSRSKYRTLIALVALAVFLVAAITTSAVRSSEPRESKTASPAAALAAPLAPLPMVVPTPTGMDPVTDELEIDGDIIETVAGPPEDWATINCGDAPNADVETFIADGLATSIFTQGGSKDPSDVSDWRHTDGSVPDKNEVLNAYAAKYTGPSGDNILAFGADRYGNDGTAFVGFWFFQQSVFPAPDGRFRQGPLNTDALATHQDGDVLVLSTYTQGGAIATSQVFQWVAGDPSVCPAMGGILQKGNTLCDITNTAPAGSVLSISNVDPQVIGGACPAWVHTPKTGPNGTIQTNAFFEGAINLDAFPALRGLCISSFMVETRSSADVNAQLKDFALGSFNTCVDIEVSKTATNEDVCVGAPVEYTYVIQNRSGVSVSATLIDDNATPGGGMNALDDFDVTTCNGGAPGSVAPQAINLQPDDGVDGSGNDQATFICQLSGLSAGTYTNTVTASANFGGSSDSATATETVTVHPNPAAFAGADKSACVVSGSHVFAMSDATATVVPDGALSWEVVAGTNTTGAAVLISNASALNPNVTLQGFGSVELRLTSSNPETGPGCSPASDTVILTLNRNPTANAGADMSACETEPSHVFQIAASATLPTGGGMITWSEVPMTNTTGQPVLISDANAEDPMVTLQGFGSVTLQMSISNDASGSGCLGSTDTVVLTLNQNPVVSIGDLACDTTGGPSVMLEAVVSAGGGSVSTSFVWKKNGMVVGNAAQLTVSSPGTYTVEVTANHGNGITSCVASKSKVVGFCASDPAP